MSGNLLDIYYIPDTVAGTEDIAWNKSGCALICAYILMEKSTTK